MIQTNAEMKRFNTLKVFTALQESALSRRELVAKSGLSWGTVFAVCNDLLQREFIVMKKETVPSGRPPQRLIVHPAKRLLLGIDINSIGLSFNLVNLACDSVYDCFLPVPSREKEELLTVIKEKVKEILTAYEGVIGISLSMQGALRREAGISVRSNFFRNWDNVPLVEIFEQEFHLPTELYHDPECLLTYNLTVDRRIADSKSGIVIRVDDGIGMAQLINGKLYEESDEATCEIGHVIVNPHGEPCVCGKRGCLETYGSLRGMKEQYLRKTGGKAQDFVALYQNGNPVAEEIVNEAAFYCGMVISNLFTLYAPSFILLDGLAINKLDGYFEKIRQATEDFSRNACNLLKADYCNNAPAVGASILTIRHKLEEILFS
ncbi:MAG: ROK family protein [Clostridia bacterium]|nr:ROK family protein [Clostridia bacterium]